MWVLSNFNANAKDFIQIKDYLISENIEGRRVNENFWLIDGFCFKRSFGESSLTETDLESLFLEHNEKFINYIKGNFIIIRIDDSGFNIYSDRFAVRKFFYWQKKDYFIITDNLKEITKRVDLNLSKENIAIYSLTYHFTGGLTAIEGVYHNQPAEIVSVVKGGNTLLSSYYWDVATLVNLPKKKITIKDLSDSLSEVISYNTEVENRISLSLTGGQDTRNLLSIFLSQGIKPHLYTYGNPLSEDCIVAKRISDELSLDHEVYNVQLDREIFERNARKIVAISGGLASIHRVHRLISVENESFHAEYMYLGTLGGEFVKGVSEDNYIDPPVVYKNWENDNIDVNDLKPLLDSKRLKLEILESLRFKEYFKNDYFFKGDKILRKLYNLSHITAHLHDAQDVNLYRSVMKEVFTPFLDVDYLELLFSSEYSFDNKEKKRNKVLKKLDNPLFGVNFINITYKPLTKIRYTGAHIPSEVLFNKYYGALIREIRRFFSRPKPQNFPLSAWMESFVKMRLPLCKTIPEIDQVFDIDALIRDFESEVHIPKESYWLKYTNPIMMSFIYDEFIKK